MPQINKVHRRVWWHVIAAYCGTTEVDRVLYLVEALRTMPQGLTPKERIYLQDRLDIIREATRDILKLAHRVKRTSV